MAERPSIPAKYDPHRTNKGHFVKGNSASKGWNSKDVKRFQEIRAAWYECVTKEDVQDVIASLIDMAKNCPEFDVRLKAQVYFLDRTYGKPTEKIEMDVTTDVSPVPVTELSAEEIAVLERLAIKTGEAVIDADFELKELPEFPGVADE